MTNLNFFGPFAGAFVALTAVAGACDAAPLCLAVELENGQRHLYEFSDQLKWQIDGNMLSVVPAEGEDMPLYIVDDVKRLTYGNFSDIAAAGVSPVTVALHGRTLNVAGAPAEAVCRIVDAAGVQVFAAVCGGECEISLDDCRPGVYVMTIDGCQAIKIVLK